ncbi:pyrroline-5-carboxylate reductase [Aestuariibacter salexigens]|uniref:pyrroline-5-carboxylate reductase n=1 Tax=Aestuariibacter salexigens TaxID=226010 RepID=UPI00040685E3|nr:pyrroline-5-carboxylate reductase [Aestuariibacter salexigens]
MQQQRLAFIGAGNMPRSIIGGLVESGYPAQNITASNPSTPKLDALQADFAIRVTTSNLEAMQQADIIVLSVKPQLMEQVCAELKQAPDLDKKVFVSIAAGIEVARLQQMLGGQYPMIRVMPNTPSLIGKGMSGVYASEEVTAQQVSQVETIMASVGKVVTVNEESMINGVIAAAGSSPAYFFLFLEAMHKEAMAMGFSRQDARTLVEQAMLGAAEMVCHNQQLELDELRAQVTSKGGTTFEAIRHFQENGLEQLVSGAMQSAVTRAEAMAKEF